VAVELSVVVVVHDMGRELPRTLRSLAPAYQRGITAEEYEVVVVDNGSSEPVDALVASFPGNARLIRLDAAPPSPARAANDGIRAAFGGLVGLVVDGARMASPGLLWAARLGATMAPRPVVTSLGWHLGDARHMDAADRGYDQATEDELLGSVDWEADGYELFAISTLAASSSRGWFGPMGESSALFMPADLWFDLGGLDERFALPGGGLVNHDLYRRACLRDDTQLVVLLGEGTFHQFHGGAATSGRFGWDEMAADYERVTGERHRPPDVPALYVGSVPPQARPHLEASVRWLMERGSGGR
jgi:hypothetical protein